MNEESIFYQDKENCKIPFTHIEEGITNPELKNIDELYGAADVLSIENAKKHERNLKLLGFFGTTITLLFLLYDEAELHRLIFGCIIIISILVYMHKLAEHSKTHEKYLQYRMLAESLRVEYFLSISGVRYRVNEMMPWFIKKGSPWIYKILSELPPANIGEKRPIINCWIRDQLKYHENALLNTTKKHKRDITISNIILYITVATYIITLIFEIYMMSIPSGEITSDFLSGILKSLQNCGVMVGFTPTNMIRSILKIIIGTMSALTLFIQSYYGKMSLSNSIEDHRRMVMLYDKANNDVLQKGENEELILTLANEYLIENTTWYAYQKKNKPDLTID